MFKNKTTIKKTIFYTDDSFIYYVFGLNCDNEPETIKTQGDIDSFKDYIQEMTDEHSYTAEESEKLKNCLATIEKELKKVDEVQVLRG